MSVLNCLVGISLFIPSVSLMILAAFILWPHPLHCPILSLRFPPLFSPYISYSLVLYLATSILVPFPLDLPYSLTSLTLWQALDRSFVHHTCTSHNTSHLSYPSPLVISRPHPMSVPSPTSHSCSSVLYFASCTRR
jgi:hypothetical protein